MRNTKAMQVVTVVMLMAIVVSMDGCFGGRGLLKETEHAPPGQLLPERVGALVLIFDSYQEGVVNLVENPAVPEKEKRILRNANRVASPAARALKHARTDYLTADAEIKRVIAEGGTPDKAALTALDLLFDTLTQSYDTNRPIIRTFQKTAIEHNVEPLLLPSMTAGLAPAQ